MMSNELLAAFNELNDAAFAMNHYQLAQATAAAERLEAARTAFHTLFMGQVTAEAITARDRR